MSVVRLVLIILICLILFSCAPRPVSHTLDSNPASENPISTASPEVSQQSDPTANLDKGNPEIGREYFLGENRGRCLKCHTLAGEGEPGTWALDDTGLRHDARWLAIFIDNPRNQRPEIARMPPFRGDPEATIADIVAFLMTLKVAVEHPVPSDVKPPDEPATYEGGVGGFQTSGGDVGEI